MRCFLLHQCCIVLALGLVIPCYAASYWVDSSCAAYPHMLSVVTESLEMGRRTAEGMDDTNDANIYAVFQRVFSTTSSDIKSIKSVIGMLSLFFCTQ